MPDISVLILENDSSFASSLKINLTKWGRLDIVLAKNIEAANGYLKNEKIDLIITKPTIDEKGDGIKFAHSLSRKNTPLIFMAESGDDTYNDAKKFNLLAYLVKPFNIKTLYATLNLYFDNKENFLIINKGKERLRVRYDDIDWIRSAGNYCIIRVGAKEYSMKISLTRLKEAFLNADFIQIHRAFVIRVDKIDDINVKMNTVNIKSSKLPIGRKYRKAFFNRIEII